MKVLYFDGQKSGKSNLAEQKKQSNFQMRICPTTSQLIIIVLGIAR